MPLLSNTSGFNRNWINIITLSAIACLNNQTRSQRPSNTRIYCQNIEIRANAAESKLFKVSESHTLIFSRFSSAHLKELKKFNSLFK